MTIKKIRTLKDAGVLADLNAQSEGIQFLRYNLIYGFNGSGKSTLSRMFASLQAGQRHKALPEGCTFEIEMENKEIYSCPDKLSGMENCVCVFNADFVEDNLQWVAGRAKPVFYIGQEQAELAAKLQKLDQSLPAIRQKQSGAERVAQERDKALTLYKRERARSISERLRQGSRKYEAPQLTQDYEKLTFGDTSVMSAEALDAVTATCARTDPLAKVPIIDITYSSIQAIAASATHIAETTIGAVIVEEFERHPGMVPWVKKGNDYHGQHDLKTCLFCGEAISEERRRLLAEAFNERLSKFIETVDEANRHADEVAARLAVALPDADKLSPELRASYQAARSDLSIKLEAAGEIVAASLKILHAKRATPTAVVASQLPLLERVAEICEQLRTSCVAANDIVAQHNRLTDDFEKHQEQARETIRRHFLAEGSKVYSALVADVQAAQKSTEELKNEVSDLEKKIEDLRAKVRAHGPAAVKINQLVGSYLGHAELTISPAAEGYELHRHGKLVKGAPSEGEKTAIALCYFLSTLESDGRQPKDLIIVVDDPISSLDTKAMNYACALIRNRLQAAAQVFVLTHNQHCMNEFKKHWKGLAYPRNNDRAATANLLYIDVTVPAGATARSASLMEMSHLLREYDSEYHFLFQKVLQFEAAGAGHSDYAYMMPNIIRRVLDVFLAFKIPRNGPLIDKIKELCRGDASIDADRMIALERLSQVESHSDSLDDLITHSSMTVEEGRDANTALLDLMSKVDSSHLAALRKYCAIAVA